MAGSYPADAGSNPASATKQTRRMSLVEAIANVAIGYAVALLTQIIVFPLFALEVSLGDNLAIGGLFTLASLARSYLLRRVFEAIREHGAETSSRRAGHPAASAVLKPPEVIGRFPQAAVA